MITYRYSEGCNCFVGEGFPYVLHRGFSFLSWWRRKQRTFVNIIAIVKKKKKMNEIRIRENDGNMESIDSSIEGTEANLLLLGLKGIKAREWY